MPSLPAFFRCSTEVQVSPAKPFGVETIVNHISPVPTPPTAPTSRTHRAHGTVVPIIGGGERMFEGQSYEQQVPPPNPPPAVADKEEERTENQVQPGAPTVVTVAIQGNVGCGKSTLLKNLLKEGYNVLPEPVSERWGIRLPTLYSDFVRWSFTFQMEVVEWYKEVQRNELTTDESNPEPKILILERSADIATQIFGKIHQEQGNMSEWEYSLLQRFGDDVFKPTFEIYVRTPAEICCDRIRERNRDGEGDIPVEFIKKVEEKHEKYYMEDGKTIRPNVVVVDGKQSKMSLTSQALEIIERFRVKDNSDTEISPW